MHKLLVLYNEPKDPAHFRKHYLETHLPLASKLPGVKAAHYTFDVKPLGPGKTPYFCIFEAEFESEAALMAALGVEGRSGGCGRRAQLCFRRRHHGAFRGEVRATPARFAAP